MTTTIAISGKGGSGKTTLAAMIVRLLCSRMDKAVLAVDADPNSSLGLTMGVQPTGTIADIREDARSKKPASGGMDKVRTFEYGIQQAITEAKGFDLLTMGRPEGPDCYCAVNNLLRKFMDNISSAYDFVVVDNEAGMEHLSRRTTNNIDLLCIVAEPTSLGALTAQRISELAGELPIVVKKTGLIWNNTSPISNHQLSIESRKSEIENIETFGCVLYDRGVLDISMEGKSIFDIDDNSPALAAVQKILEHVLVLSP